MSDFTLSLPLSWQQFYVMPPPLVFQPPPDNYCTVPNFFQLQDFHRLLYFCFISQKNMAKGAGGSGGWGLEMTVESHLGGATCRGLVSLPHRRF